MYQEYPNEPKANNSTRLKISDDGRVINGHAIVSRIEHPDGGIEYQMEYEGKDDSKKAIIRQTLIIGPDVFIRQKEVKFNPNESWILRNTFSYVKKK